MKRFPSNPRLSCLVSALACSVSLTACGGSSGDGGSGGNGETTVDDWQDYCIATFTEEYPVLDFFGDVAFTAHVGDEFVMASFDVGENPELLYLAETGPEVLELEESDGTLPFVSNCTAGSTTNHIAIFSDTTVYAEQELTTPICELSAGHAVPHDPTTQSGYATTGDGFGDTTTYEVYLNALSAECGGASLGYISVPQTTVFGTITYLIPIQLIVGPA